MPQAQWMLDSEIGRLYLVASEKGLQTLFWEKQQAPMATSLEGSEPEIQVLSLAVKQVTEYLQAKRKTFDLPMDLVGTEFQMRVWQQLSQIPFGETRTYSEIARKLGKEKAVRAVGTANGKNPLCILVPCHRVIAADGKLGGYSGGFQVKARLLGLEGVAVQSLRMQK